MPIVNLPETCEGCGACCYGLVAEVTEEDFAVHGTPRDVVAVIPDPEGADDPILALRQVEEDHKRCIALDPETRRCTIYANRPQVCRDFSRGDDPAAPNNLCFDVVNGMRVEQGRMALPPRTRFQEALAALRRLTPADVDAATPVEQLAFLRHAVELQSGITLTMLAELRTGFTDLRKTVALLAYAQAPEAKPLTTDTVSTDAAQTPQA